MTAFRKSFDDHHVADLLGIGALAPAADPGRVVAALRAVPAAATAQLLRRHKVLLAAERRLAGWRADGTFADEQAEATAAAVDDVLATRRTRIAGLADQLDAVTEIAAATGVPITLMKGVTLRTWYPDEFPRDIGDIDLWVPTLDDAYALTGVLEARGHALKSDELPWVKQTAAGHAYGVFNLRDPAGNSFSMDIHYGVYSVRHCGSFRPHVQVTEHGSRLDPASDLACAIANAAGDAFIDVKTLNDVWLAAHRPDLDWGLLHTHLDEAGLGAFFAAVLHRLALIHRPPTDPAAVERLRPAVAPERLPELTAPRSAHRWYTTVCHAWQRGGASLRRSMIFAGTAARYYALPLRPHVLTGRRGWGRHRAPQPAAYNCVRLIPADRIDQVFPGPVSVPSGGPGPAPVRSLRPLADSGVLSVVATAEGDLIRASDGRVFVPTVYYGVPARLLAAARTLAAADVTTAPTAQG
ncbi:nucleotidyltransferase family protein [Streptomyces chartreusis]|uniref:nucleotidyltransferase family protein n=1 Tax=Streptomyces chartreusis TaxID=1969 RepID=UPI0033A6F777